MWGSTFPAIVVTDNRAVTRLNDDYNFVIAHVAEQ